LPTEPNAHHSFRACRGHQCGSTHTEKKLLGCTGSRISRCYFLDTAACYSMLFPMQAASCVFSTCSCLPLLTCTSDSLSFSPLHFLLSNWILLNLFSSDWHSSSSHHNSNLLLGLGNSKDIPEPGWTGGSGASWDEPGASDFSLHPVIGL